MINKKVLKLLNEQIVMELYSAYLYVEIANHFEREGYPGFAHWYMVQAMEERDHALYIREYILHRGEDVELGAIDKPELDVKGLVEPFKAALDHEYFISRAIDKIYAVAIEEKDYASVEYLHWFIKEQAEEEANALYNVEEASLREKSVGALKQLEKEFSKREYEKETPEL